MKCQIQLIGYQIAKTVLLDPVSPQKTINWRINEMINPMPEMQWDFTYITVPQEGWWRCVRVRIIVNSQLYQLTNIEEYINRILQIPLLGSW